jgi:hypothetical protein
MTVGFARHAAQIVLGNGVTDERTNDLDRNLRIGAAASVASTKPSGGASPLVEI